MLLRGEQPDVPTGYNLVSTMYGNVVYVPRSVYADREEMLIKHAGLVADGGGSAVSLTDMLEAPTRIEERGGRRVAIVNEGAGDSLALLGKFGVLQGELAFPSMIIFNMIVIILGVFCLISTFSMYFSQV